MSIFQRILHIPQDMDTILISTLLILALSVAAMLCDSFVVIVLGFPLVLFLPGYILMTILFPKKDDLDIIERILLSIALSITIIPTTGLILNFFQLKLFDTSSGSLSSTPFFSLLFLLLALFTIIAYIRRRKHLSREEHFDIQFSNIIKLKPFLDWLGMEKSSDKIISIVLVSLIVFTSIGIVYAIHAEENDPLTEFYILNQDGKASNYPIELNKDGSATITVGVINHENKRANYTLQIKLKDKILDTQAITLQDKEKWERRITLEPVAVEIAEKHQLKLLLYKDKEEKDAKEPYRRLHLWTTVT